MARATSITVVGAGAWGTAIANLVAQNGARVYLWASQQAQVDEMMFTGRNEKYLPGVRLRENVFPTKEIKSGVLGSSLFIWAIPVQFLRERIRGLAPHFARGLVHVNVGKGIEQGTWALPSRILADECKTPRAVGSLVGPNIASEVAAGMYTEAALAVSEESLLEETAASFTTDCFRIHTTTDLVGVEVGAALKNVCALAAGLCDGLELGANTKALVIAVGLDEIRRLGVFLGARAETFSSSCVLGDVLASGYSPAGRNRRVGEYLAVGCSLDEALALLKGRISEGVATCRACQELQSALGIRLPFVASLAGLLEGQFGPRACIQRILAGRAEFTRDGDVKEFALSAAVDAPVP
jgi:glycerol-3-phosphate dehydrogenase (NAD(P)+)